MRLAVLFPLACSIVAFVLGFLALFAGQKPGFMEDYAILRVSTLLSSLSRRGGLRAI